MEMNARPSRPMMPADTYRGIWTICKRRETDGYNAGVGQSISQLSVRANVMPAVNCRI